ncbi:MAG: hypothetical protein ACLFQV_07350 [Vulcanimicrobiota bacterium]
MGIKKWLICLFLVILGVSGRVSAGEPDRFVKDRFIFVGEFQKKPIITTVEFSRGYTEKVRNRYSAKFRGHFLFAGKWHQLKNCVFEESAELNSEKLKKTPEFEPCILVWDEEQKKGAINYDREEISFLLQFKDLTILDNEGPRDCFKIQTGTAQAFLLFQGKNIPGKLFYQRFDLKDYNPFVNNFNHLKRKNLQQFFLVSASGNAYIIWKELEGSKIRGQWICHDKFITLVEQGKPLVSSRRLDLEILATRSENNPESKFRTYPVAWKINKSFSEIGELDFLLRSEDYFYWFGYGLFSVEGTVNNEKVFGLAEVIRGN